MHRIYNQYIYIYTYIHTHTHTQVTNLPPESLGTAAKYIQNIQHKYKKYTPHKQIYLYRIYIYKKNTGATKFEPNSEVLFSRIRLLRQDRGL